MLKISDLLFSTRAGKLAVRVCALVLLLALVVLAAEMPAQVMVMGLSNALLALALTFKNEISRHRGSIADRACALLPVAQSTIALAFAFLPVPVRFYTVPARIRPRLAAGRFGRLPAVTLSPRLLPVPSDSA